MAAPCTHEAQADRMAQAWAVLAQVPDPELPMVSLCDLGMVRGLVQVDGVLEVAVTPTYSGCPATEFIARSIVEALDAAGLSPAAVRLQRAPAWTTDWISAEGRAKLREHGVAPPGTVQAPVLRFVAGAAARASPACPHCASVHTQQLSAFGSTACKALHRCLDCREPFEYFKPI